MPQQLERNKEKNKCDKQTWFLEWIGSGNLVEGIKFAIGKHKDTKTSNKCDVSLFTTAH